MSKCIVDGTRCNCLTLRGTRCTRKATLPEISPFTCKIHLDKCSYTGDKLNLSLNSTCPKIIPLSVIKSRNYGGNTAKVWYCMYDKDVVILKRIDNSIECSLLKNVTHENIVKMIKCWTMNTRTYMLLKCYRGDLSSINRRTLTSHTLTDLHFQLLQGLNFIHAINIAHCDIHDKNIFWDTVDGSVRYVLADFDRAVHTYDMDTLSEDVKSLKRTLLIYATPVWKQSDYFINVVMSTNIATSKLYCLAKQKL